jgi:2-dehydro-3-deoxyphosphogluconate aldolase/(4S)-4-hydroxy-2-oxoglutarate aldolase
MSERLEVPEQLRTTRVVAVVRGHSAQHLTAAVRALVASGLRCIELTLNTPGALDALTGFAASHKQVAWGAGTVLSADGVRSAAAAGARFAIAPDVNPAVAKACATQGIAWIPGAATPTEIALAWSLGAAAVKVFPARSLGGPDYLREVRAPLGFIPLVPTGGVALDAVADYLAAGALAVGLGGALLGDALRTGDTAALAERAGRALASARPTPGRVPDQ